MLTRERYEQTKSTEDYDELRRAEELYKSHLQIQRILNTNKDGFYKILGVSDKTSLKGIKPAFLTKSRLIHPEVSLVRGGEEALRILQRAYFSINTREKQMRINGTGFNEDQIPFLPYLRGQFNFQNGVGFTLQSNFGSAAFRAPQLNMGAVFRDNPLLTGQGVNPFLTAGHIQRNPQGYHRVQLGVRPIIVWVCIFLALIIFLNHL